MLPSTREELSDDNVEKAIEALLVPRILVSLIPGIGSAATLIVDEFVARRQRKKLEVFLAAIETSQAKDLTVSDELLEHTVHRVKDSTEKWKPEVLAKILTSRAHDDNEIFKRLLIDHTSQLTDFDMINFWALVAPAASAAWPNLNYEFAHLDLKRPELHAIRNVSKEKLVQLGFLRRNSTDGLTELVASEIGKALVEIIK